MITSFPFKRLDPSTALLRTSIQAWQQNDTARLEMILQQAKTQSSRWRGSFAAGTQSTTTYRPMKALDFTL